MVELANTVEYAEYKQLESVEVGDTITCRHKGIKIEVKARCIRIKWNCITKENEEVELGNFLENYFDKTSSSIQRATASIEGANSQALAAKEVAEKAAKEATSAQTAAETAKGKAETAAGTASTKAQEAQAAAETAAAGGENAQHYYELTKELYDNASIQAGQSSEAWLDLSYVNNCYLSE